MLDDGLSSRALARGRGRGLPRAVLQEELGCRSRHRAFFDSVPWDLMLKAVAHHTDQKWIVTYVERWLKAPMQRPDGTLVPRVKGTPQGGPISPCLANLFLHYGLDAWLVREFPTVQFERFEDDAVIHCVSESQARLVPDAVARRLVKVGLELHPEKTRIVYCKDSRRSGALRRFGQNVWEARVCGEWSSRARGGRASARTLRSRTPSQMWGATCGVCAAVALALSGWPRMPSSIAGCPGRGRRLRCGWLRLSWRGFA